jgi:tetratricopeptide (TPR) repeat protein
MPDSAAFFFRKAVYHKPDFYQAYFNLGMHAYASRNYVEAAEYFEKAQNPNALDEATLYNYGLTLEQLNRLEEANRYFKKVELMRGDLRKQAEQAKIRCENKLKSNSNANKSKANT